MSTLPRHTSAVPEKSSMAWVARTLPFNRAVTAEDEKALLEAKLPEGYFFDAVPEEKDEKVKVLRLVQDHFLNGDSIASLILWLGSGSETGLAFQVMVRDTATRSPIGYVAAIPQNLYLKKTKETKRVLVTSFWTVHGHHRHKGIGKALLAQLYRGTRDMSDGYVMSSEISVPGVEPITTSDYYLSYFTGERVVNDEQLQQCFEFYTNFVERRGKSELYRKMSKKEFEFMMQFGFMRLKNGRLTGVSALAPIGRQKNNRGMLLMKIGEVAGPPKVPVVHVEPGLGGDRLGKLQYNLYWVGMEGPTRLPKQKVLLGMS